MTILIETRGPKTGKCNICGELGPLTEDHTPPKGCLKPRQVEIHHISSLLSQGEAPTRGRRSQNGVKYRTLCHRCNNTLLGARYDPLFIEFVNNIGQLLKTSMQLPSALSIRGQPQAILRSLLGHIAAQGVDRYLKGPLTESIRDYILDETKPFPEELCAYYWVYPYKPHVMVRDAAFLDIPSGKPFSIWLLKFFPVAFLVTWGRPTYLEYSPHSFESWRSCPFRYEVEMPLTLQPVLPVCWPEAPSNRTVLVYGQEAIHVVGESQAK
ncbi:MAG: hypothetical protein HOP20_04600 [Sulfuriferula sp.]|nr:hypothetical protein [Sulfuriferula sp.]